MVSIIKMKINDPAQGQHRIQQQGRSPKKGLALETLRALKALSNLTIAPTQEEFSIKCTNKQLENIWSPQLNHLCNHLSLSSYRLRGTCPLSLRGGNDDIVIIL
jgi:hypothetical protein